MDYESLYGFMDSATYSGRLLLVSVSLLDPMTFRTDKVLRNECQYYNGKIFAAWIICTNIENMEMTCHYNIKISLVYQKK